MLPLECEVHPTCPGLPPQRWCSIGLSFSIVYSLCGYSGMMQAIQIHNNQHFEWWIISSGSSTTRSAGGVGGWGGSGLSGSCGSCCGGGQGGGGITRAHFLDGRVLFSLSAIIGPTPLGHPLNWITRHPSQRSKFSSRFRWDAQDTTASLVRAFLAWDLLLCCRNYTDVPDFVFLVPLEC